MLHSFRDFYTLVKGSSLDWLSLEDSLKIKEAKYPSNSEIELYYYENFNGKTSNFGRSKWHVMDKLLCAWVVAHYCRLASKNLLTLDVRNWIFRKMTSKRSPVSWVFPPRCFNLSG